jgi:BASS family bile acid:Na+ symporter
MSDAQKLFNVLFNAGLVVMIVALIVSLGMSFTIRQIVAPLRRVGVVVGIIVANEVVPGAAWGVATLFALTNQERAALVLVTAAAAGPACLKVCEFSKRANMALAVSMVVILQLLNIVFAPLWCKAAVSGATVSVWMIIKDLVGLVLLPVAIGLFVKARYSERAEYWGPALEKTSNIALVIALVAGVAVYWRDLWSLFGSRVIVASIVIAVVAAALGWLGAFWQRDAAITSVGVTSLRFTPIGLVVIMTQLNGNGAYLAPALVFALVDTIVPFAIGLELGRSVTKQMHAVHGVHPTTAAANVPTPA